MAADRILQNEITALGQSQDDRSPAALDPDFAPIDDRRPAERIAEARRLAAHLRFYGVDPDAPSGDWQGLFPPGAEMAVTGDAGTAPPHLGLFGAFLDMLEPARLTLNDLGRQHLDFQYRRVLGFTPLPALPEHAHVTLELKKGAAPLAIAPEHLFSGGKDAAGVERRYQPVRETVIGQGKIAALHSVYRDAGGVRFAPVADSADGLGTPLDPATPSWSAFGHAGLSPAPLGFACASSLLRLQEGTRTVTLGLELTFMTSSGLTPANIADSLQAWVTGEKAWLGPYSLTAAVQGAQLQLGFVIPAGDPAVVACQPAIHGAAFVTDLPVMQLLLRPEAAARYAALASLRPEKLQLAVTVDGIKGLNLENDFGPLNSRKAFQPFGPQPVAGSRFLIGCPEALAKPLTDLRVHLTWQGAPANLRDWYANYDRRNQIADGVQARLVYEDGSGTQTIRELNVMNRVDGVTTLSPYAPLPVAPIVSEYSLAYTLLHGGSSFARWFGTRVFKRRYIHVGANPPPPPAPRPGFITVALIEDFLHADYRRQTLADPKTSRNEPYTPLVQDIVLTYGARSASIDVYGDDETAFAAAADLQFFHIGAFGARREHPFLRRDLGWVADKRPGLLPACPDEGEFIVGVNGVGAGDSIHLLLQVAEGSADPVLAAQAVNWSVLCDNHWRRVAPDELALETTRSLRVSGLVGIVLSRNTTIGNSWLPAGPVWLMASIAQGSAAACRLLGVHANAVEVVRRWPDGGAPPIETLPPGSIAKLLAPPAAIKNVTQPYATFGGRAVESAAMLDRRAAERLRHRQRCITPWDYERLLLQAFHGVHRVKCIPHAGEGGWMMPGHVLIVAVPDLRNRNLPDLLQPRVDLDTLTQMTALAQAHASPQVTVKVRNPDYQPIRLDFKVRFRAGYPFEHTRQQLHAALVDALSPWAFEAGRQLDFGGRIYRSVLLDFVEELPYVDYVTDFRCGLAGSGDTLLNDVAEIVADRPDVILVSAARHVIGEATD